MKIVVVTKHGSLEFDSFSEMSKLFSVDGYTEDLSDVRAKGGFVHRAELDNCPTYKGLCGPMWDGGGYRYEDWETYDLLSR